MARQFEDIADFQTIYIKEAHPEDQWRTPENRKEGILYHQPKTSEERLQIARAFQRSFNLQLPLLVDPIDNAANRAFAAWPERIYILDPSRRIVYKGGMGPDDFRPEEARQFLTREYTERFGSQPPRQSQ